MIYLEQENIGHYWSNNFVFYICLSDIAAAECGAAVSGELASVSFTVYLLLTAQTVNKGMH